MTAYLKLEIHQPSIHKNHLRSTASIFVFLLLTKRHVSHLSTKKHKKHTNEKTGGKVFGKMFSLWGVFLSVGRGTLVLRVPEDLPLDLVVPWWIFRWSRGSLGWILLPPKTLGGAETPGVFSCFFWLVNPIPWKFGRARYTLHPLKFWEARFSPQKVGSLLFLGYAFVAFTGGKIRHFGAPFF